MVELHMATVVIGGASRGIGLELTRQYAGRTGDRVFAFCRSPEKADALNAIAGASGGRVTVHPLDVADGRSIAQAAKVLGDEGVDVLLNVAGVGGGKQGLYDSDFDDWRDAFEVMVIGPFRMVQALLPNLEKARGRVMTVSSQMGASTWPYGGTYAYCGAKAAVNQVMRTLAVELTAKGVAVALIHPGWVKTDMGGASAEIEVEESASGIRAVVDRLTLADTGTFWKWTGEQHPW